MQINNAITGVITEIFVTLLKNGKNKLSDAMKRNLGKIVIEAIGNKIDLSRLINVVTM
jgi:hypothetical protein